MIGCYDYTVVMTYLGLISALVGIVQCIQGNFVAGLFLLGGSLFCDTLDGKIARSKKNRTRREQLFGIQIDSLCDVISFGIAPAVMCYCYGLRDWPSLILLGYYCLCCVIRLGYFNVLAMENDPDSKGVFHGLPVVCLAVLMPLAFLTSLWLPTAAVLWIMRAVFLVMGTLYITDFKVKKPGWMMLVILCVIFWLPLALFCIFG